MSKIKHNVMKINLIVSGLILFLTQFGIVNLNAQSVVTLTTETSWTCPSGVNTIQIECWGAGGGGGGATSSAGRAGGGGAGGAYVKNTSVAVTPGTTYSISIGAGGTAGTSSSATCNGSTGGNTTATIGSVTITAAGGVGGTGGASATGGIGTGGVGTTTGNAGFSDSFNFAGGNGANGILSTRTGGGGGAGGSNGAGGNASSTDVTGGIAGTGGGNGANGVSATAVGIAGNAPGGGGSGGSGRVHGFGKRRSDFPPRPARRNRDSGHHADYQGDRAAERDVRLCDRTPFTDTGTRQLHDALLTLRRSSEEHCGRNRYARAGQGHQVTGC